MSAFGLPLHDPEGNPVELWQPMGRDAATWGGWSAARRVVEAPTKYGGDPGGASTALASLAAQHDNAPFDRAVRWLG